MVDTINELSSLSRKLNEKSDKTNSIIETINKKLAALNLGLEVWLDEPIESGDLRKTYGGSQQDPLPRQRRVTYLGYCKVEDSWQLATKTGTAIEDFDKDTEQVETEFTDPYHRPLVKEARDIRIRALSLVHELLFCLKRRAESVLDSIDKAEKAAEQL